MILTQIKEAQLQARKARQTHDASLLTTIIGEAEMAGKDAGNRAPTDAEVLQVLRKFEKNMLSNMSIYSRKGLEDNCAATMRELEIVRRYLPAKITDLQVQKDIGIVMQQLNLAKEQKSMGPVVKALKEKYGEQFDGQQVNTQFSRILL